MSEETNPQEDNSVLASFRQVLYPLAEADRLYEAGKPVDIAKVLQQAQQAIYNALTPEQAITDYSAHDLLLDYWNQVKRRTNTATTGLRSLDDALSGGIEAAAS
jgi:hypothetical protein